MNDNYIRSIALQKGLDQRSYLNALAVVKWLSENGPLEFNSKVSFFVGENGVGKSTLLEAIAIAYGFNPEGGTKNFNFEVNPNYSELYKNILIDKGRRARDGFFLRAESFYNVATRIDELNDDGGLIESYGGTSLHERSHGESFIALIENRFGGGGVYLLDEPEAALSPSRLLSLLVQINELVKLDSQFIIATHSPILMAYPGADIFLFDEEGIKKTDYKDTEHYRLTKRFLDDPDSMLKYLLE